MKMNEIHKYVFLTGITFIILKYCPNYKMTVVDIFLTSIILVLSYILLEKVYAMYYKDTENYLQNIQGNRCSGCNNCSTGVMENMENVHHKPHHKHEKKLAHKSFVPLYERIPHADGVHSQEYAPVHDSSGKYHTDTLHDSSGKYHTDTLHDSSGKYHIDPEQTMRRDKGVIINESPYSDFYHVPLSDYDTGSFEYGYSFLPPEKWYPQPANPPVCVVDKQCPVMPMYTTGVPIDVKEWHESRRITPSANINEKYVHEKLNSGR